MIRVTIELFSARTGGKETLGIMDIYNRGDGSDARGNYGVKVYKKGCAPGPHAAIARSGCVDDFPRKSYNVWRLILRALKATFPEEK